MIQGRPQCAGVLRVCWPVQQQLSAEFPQQVLRSGAKTNPWFVMVCPQQTSPLVVFQEQLKQLEAEVPVFLQRHGWSGISHFEPSEAPVSTNKSFSLAATTYGCEEVNKSSASPPSTFRKAPWPPGSRCCQNHKNSDTAAEAKCGSLSCKSEPSPSDDLQVVYTRVDSCLRSGTIPRPGRVQTSAEISKSGFRDSLPMASFSVQQKCCWKKCMA